MIVPPPKWDLQRLTTDAKTGRANFRKERLEEPLANWKDAFATYKGNFRRLLVDHGAADLKGITPEKLAAIFADDLEPELRYLAGPPISADDLKVLAETTLAPGVLKQNPEAAQRVLDTILQALDPYRFPWIADDR